MPGIIFTTHAGFHAARRQRPQPFNPTGYLDTLTAAQDYVDEHLPTADGVSCPCCSQPCKLYPEPLNRPLVLPLAWMCRTYRERPRWVHMQTEAPRAVITANKYGLLHWWDLIEEEANDNPTKRKSGRWRPKPLAYEFIEQRASLPKYVFLFNDTYFGCTQDVLTTITEALGETWDYESFMRLSAEELGACITERQSLARSARRHSLQQNL